MSIKKIDNIKYDNKSNLYLIGKFYKDIYMGDGVIINNNKVITVGNWKRKILNYDFTCGYNSMDYIILEYVGIVVYSNILSNNKIRKKIVSV